MTQNGFFFSPNDWVTDEKLQLCSLAAKGMWIDLICWMYKSKRVGYLVVNGKSLDENDICKLLKCGREEFKQAWSDLVSYGVISQHEDGTYYSKRIVQDMERRNPQYGLSPEDVASIDKVLSEFERIIVNHAAYNVKEARDLIAMRMRYDKAKLEDFVIVIKGKLKEWDNDKMRVNLRPRTLFNEKFSDYLLELKPKAAAAENRKVVPGFDYGDL